MQQLMGNDDPKVGYDVQARKVSNLVEAEILDPLPVVVQSVAVAYSVARRFVETVPGK
jgi:hypothetical protein